MTDKEKLDRMKKLADAMYTTAQYLTTDASGLRKAMDEYHRFIITEYRMHESASEDFESEWKRYCDSKGGGAVTMNIKDVAKHFAQWQKEQDYKNLERLKKSWFKEGKIEGKFEGITDDVKYQQGYHDAKEQMMKDAIDTRIDKRLANMIGYTGSERVKVIIVKDND